MKSVPIVALALLLVLSCSDAPPGPEASKLLETTVLDIDFDETPLPEALAFLADETEVPIAFESGLPQAGLTVTLRADAVKASDALKLICLTKRLSWTVKAGRVVVEQEGPAPGALVLDLYDVKDMTVPIRSWPGRSGPGSALDDDWETAPDPLLEFEGDALADLIREVIDPEVWEADGVVEYREGGILIVKAPSGTHQRIRRLLEGLRSAADPR